jgi:hypothetical protein
MSLKSIVLGTLLIPLLAGGSRAAPAEAPADVPSPGLQYWYSHSIIVAKVKSVPNRDLIVVVPLGTLAGSLDAGTTPEVRARLVRDRWGMRSLRDPVVGDVMILVAEGTGDWPSRTGRYQVMEYAPEGFNEPNGPFAPNGILIGRADPHLTDVLRHLQQQRANDDRANDPTDARLRKYFASHPRMAVVCADIEELGPEHTIDGTGHDITYALNFRVRRLLSGSDVGDVPGGMQVCFPPGDNWGRFRLTFRKPRVGKTAIIAVTIDENYRGPYFVSSHSLEFMPGDCSPICEITRLDDPKVEETGNALKISAYWKTHCLVYASIAGITNPGGHGNKKIALRPTLTISGAFDCSATPELTANVEKDGFWDRIPTPAEGDKALVLLTEKGDSYVITGEAGSTIAGMQSPICLVSDLEDRRIEEALSAVRKQRNARIRSDKLPIESFVVSEPSFVNDAPDVKCVWGDVHVEITPGPDGPIPALKYITPGTDDQARIERALKTAHATLAMRVDITGSAPAGKATGEMKFRAEYSYEGIKAGQLVAMLGGVFRVESVKAWVAGGNVLSMDRVTDPALLDEIGIGQRTGATSVGDQVRFRYDDGPDVAIVRLKSISGGKSPSAMLEVRANTVETIHAASGDIVRLGRDLSLRIGKIIPQDGDRGIRGWVELEPIVNPAADK